MEALSKFTIVILLVVLSGLILGFPIMWLWNALLPDIFGVATIGFWQALGLYLLCGLLIKSDINLKEKN